MVSASHLPPPASQIPVIAIDGPSASGKGAVAQRVAERLGFHYLDSGAIYRVAALAAIRARIALDDEPALARLAGRLDVRFADERILLSGEDVTEQARAEACGNAASEVAGLPALRRALLDWQRSFRRTPGLVADGRDMGTAVFADAELKVFLYAALEVRAERRHKQLMGKGIHASISAVLQDLQRRDVRDARRAVAPLQKAVDAIELDTSELTLEQAVEWVLSQFRGSAPKPP